MTASSVFALCTVYFTLDTHPESFLTLRLHQSPVGTQNLLMRMNEYRNCFKYMRKAYEGHDNTDLITHLALGFTLAKHIQGIFLRYVVLFQFELSAPSNHIVLPATRPRCSMKGTSGHSNNLVHRLRHLIVKAK